MLITNKHLSLILSPLQTGLVVVRSFILTALTLTLCTCPAYADEHYQFAMYATTNSTNDKCELKARYSANKKDQLSFTGKQNDQGCWISIPKAQYTSRFSFCYLSGINLHNTHAGQSVECFIQERDNDYAFNAYIGQNNKQHSQIMCYFTCIGRDME